MNKKNRFVIDAVDFLGGPSAVMRLSHISHERSPSPKKLKTAWSVSKWVKGRLPSGWVIWLEQRVLEHHLKEAADVMVNLHRIDNLNRHAFRPDLYPLPDKDILTGGVSHDRS